MKKFKIVNEDSIVSHANFIRKSLWIVVIILLTISFIFMTNGVVSDNKIIAKVDRQKNGLIIENNINQKISNNNENNGDVDENVYAYIDLNANYFLQNEELVIPFAINDDSQIVDFSYSNNGLSIISAVISGNKVVFTIEYLQSEEQYSLLGTIVLETGNNIPISFYAISNEYGFFFSPFSEDDAHEKYIDYALVNNIMTNEQCTLARVERFSKGVEVITNTFSNNKNGSLLVADQGNVKLVQDPSLTTSQYVSTRAAKDTFVSGTLTWDDDNNVTHPLRRVMIRIYDKEPAGETHLGTAYADNSGAFSYTFQNQDGFWDFDNGGCDIFARIYAGDSNALLKIGSGSSDYYFETGVSVDVSTGSRTNYTLNFNMSNDLGRAFQISQAILTARDFAWDMGGSMPSDIVTRYPNGNGCSYNRSEKRINITGTPRTNTSVPNSYASWDIIMHEYGHHVSYEKGIINSPGGSHYINSNLADDRNNKDEGVRLAWSESWATVFGFIVQDYYHNYLVNIDTVDDTIYDAYNISTTLDIDSHYYFDGEAGEMSVMAVLWDLYDYGMETNDTISLGYQSWWDLTTGGGCTTFSAFITRFYNLYAHDTNALGANLSYYGMAATSPTITNLSSISATVSPKFSWTPQGGSTKYPNNMFTLNFYTSPNQNIPYYSISNIASTSLDTISQSQWNEIRSRQGTIYVAVKTENTYSPTTGPYISKFVSFTNNFYEPLSLAVIISSSSKLYEHTNYYSAGEIFNYKVKFASAGNKAIQTFGPKDAYIYLYSADGTLLAYDDDSGYSSNALLNYTLQANVEYTIRVKFYNASQSGEIKLAIMQSYRADNTYEEIRWSNFNSGTFGWGSRETVKINSVNMHTITTEIADDFVITTTQENNCNVTDTYLYFIDPSSTAYSIYNDDGGEGLNAKLNVRLDANKTYLLIVSAYNISNTSGDIWLQIDRI